jgi:hypothetical protein
MAMKFRSEKERDEYLRSFYTPPTPVDPPGDSGESDEASTA